MLFRPEVAQFRRILDSAALALALRRWRHTSADLGDLSEVPGGGGGLSGRIVWGSIKELSVWSDPVRSRLSTLAGVPASRIRVSPRSDARAETPSHPPRPPAPVPELPPWNVTSPGDWEGLMTQVRSRAVLDRAALEGIPPGQSPPN
jgi:hypothetical protein